MTKEMLKKKIREVSIAKTYDEYVDALAEHLTVDVAREIFEEIKEVAIIGDITGRVIITASDFAELKKKYIGEDINVTTNTEGGE